MEKRRVEVVFAHPRRPQRTSLSLRAGATAWDAVMLSGLAERGAALDPAVVGLAIAGKSVPFDRVLANGERIEVLRPLAVAPIDARRHRVRRGA